MTETLVLMIDDAPHWLRIHGGEITARGEGLAAFRADDHVVAVVPARDVTIHHAALPDLSEPQAQAAARLVMAQQSASLVETLHVAVGKATGAGDRPIVAISKAKMAALLIDLAAQGHDPDAVLAAPMLLARPEAGFVKGNLGTETILRGPENAFLDDAILTPLLAGGAVTMLDRVALERGLIQAVANPEVDLRQGQYAKRRAWGLDQARLRKIGWLALGIGAMTLLFYTVQLGRISRAADRIDAANVVAARAALPPGTTINNPVLQIEEQLNSLRGPGGGMVPLAAAVASAVSATPNLELTSLVFDGGGTLRITARAPTPTDQVVFEAKLKEFGLTAASGPTLVDQGQQIRDYTVSIK